METDPIATFAARDMARAFILLHFRSSISVFTTDSAIPIEEDNAAQKNPT